MAESERPSAAVGAPTHVVVVNDEEQYSLWAAGRELPPGWRDAGFRGSEQACLDHIEQVWTDLRPRSVRAGVVEPPVVLEAERVVLRELPPDEARALLAGDPCGRPWTAGYPIEGTLVAARMHLREEDAGERRRGFGMYQVIRRADGVVLGDVGFHCAPREGRVEIGFGLADSARGRGYATDAVARLAAWAFEQPDVDVVHASTTFDNVPSQNVMRRAGFHHVRDEGDTRYYELRRPARDT